MKFLALAAGYGTRLKELGENIPKALLAVGKKPLINHILDKVKHIEGLDEVLVVTNNKFHVIFRKWAEEQKNFPAPITIINDGTNSPEERLGSIGDIDFVLKRQSVDDDVLVVGGDNLFDYDIDEYIRFARTKAPAVSIGLYDVGSLKEATKFGVVALDAGEKITSFEEKPPQPRSTLVAMCFYYLPKKSLGLIRDYLVESKKFDTAGDYIKWLHKKTPVYGFKFTGTWYDIGSIEAYHEAQKKFSV